jgi:radical SAM protein with 4Fe4S-binding SPASM domain
MISKFLIFREFGNNFIVVDKFRKDIYFLEKDVFKTLKYGRYDKIEDPNGLITNILEYLNPKKSKPNLIRTANYKSLDDAFYDFDIPIFCTIETTNACNLNCTHCYHGSFLNKKKELLDLKLIESISNQLYKLGTIVVTLTGGEFFLRDDYVKILEIFTKYDFLILVFTNGILLNEDKRNVLDSFSVDLVQVSLYGEHEFETEIQQNTNFKLAFENLISAQENFFATTVVLTPLQNNYPFIESLVKKLKSRGIQYSFNASINPSREFSTENLINCIDTDEKYLNNLSQIGDLAKPQKRNSIYTKPCNAGRNIIHINYEGDVNPCISWPKYIGNVKKEQIENLYNSRILKDIRSIKISDIHKCHSCKNSLNCNICLGSNYLINGDWNIPNERLCIHNSILQSLYRQKEGKGATAPISPAIFQYQ